MILSIFKKLALKFLVRFDEEPYRFFPYNYSKLRETTIYLMMTTEILACSLANFHCQKADRHINLCDASMTESGEFDYLIGYRKKQIDVGFSWVSPVVDNEFRHIIAKEVCYQLL